jgi:hypothetical protein
VTVNTDSAPAPAGDANVKSLNAEGIAMASGYPRSVNLVMLGFSLAVMEKAPTEKHLCTLADIREVMETRLKDKPGMLESSLMALSAGYDADFT